MPDAVRVRGLAKRYRTTFSVRRNAKIATGREPPREHVALRDVSFHVREGEVYGVLGPNGAGKTTLMKLLATILLPDEGDLEILGVDAVRDAEAVRPRLGVVLGEYERTFHWRLTGLQNLVYFGSFFDLPRDESRRRGEALLKRVGLEDRADRLFLEYSTGQKHRLALARGLLNDPRLLILDEPTAGLDLVSTEAIGQIVRDVAAAGTAVCYTTHRLQEAGRLCDRVLILNRGEKVAEASPQDLVRMAREKVALDFVVEGGPADLAERVARVPGVGGASWFGRILRVQVDDVDARLEPVAARLRDAGARVRSVQTHAPTVEDVFRELTEAPEVRA